MKKLSENFGGRRNEYSFIDEINIICS